MGEVITIAVPIILAIWSGAGFLAIKHPDTYRTFGIPAFFAAALLSSILVGYAAGIMSGQDAVLNFMRADGIMPSHAAAQSAASVPFVWGVLIGGFAMGLMAIGAIGQHIERQREEEDTKDSKGPQRK